jgi:hypothetical protein
MPWPSGRHGQHTVAHRPIVGPTRVAFGSTGQGLEGVRPNRPPWHGQHRQGLAPTVAFLLAHADLDGYSTRAQERMIVNIEQTLQRSRRDGGFHTFTSAAPMTPAAGLTWHQAGSHGWHPFGAAGDVPVGPDQDPLRRKPIDHIIVGSPEQRSLTSDRFNVLVAVPSSDFFELVRVRDFKALALGDQHILAVAQVEDGPWLDGEVEALPATPTRPIMQVPPVPDEPHGHGMRSAVWTRAG